MNALPSPFLPANTPNINKSPLSKSIAQPFQLPSALTLALVEYRLTGRRWDWGYVSDLQHVTPTLCNGCVTRYSLRFQGLGTWCGVRML